MTAKSWDDIDLGGLTMETDDDQVSDSRQDRQERIDLDKLKKLVFGLGDFIPVEIDNPSGNLLFKGEVQDISPNGIKVVTTGTCEKGDIVRLIFSIGKRRLIMRADVRWNTLAEGKNIVGMQFIKQDKKDVEFITSIFTAMHLR